MKQFTALSHNAFWFQGTPFPTDQPPAPDMEVVKRLCAIYREVDPDVICLQEIQNRETLDAVAEHLAMRGSYCPGTALPQYGGGVFWHPDRGRPMRNSQGSAVRTQRMWQAVEATGSDCRLRIGNVHLPSERQLSREQAAAQRLAELEDLIASAEAGLDIIVGDFNEQPDGPVGECLARHGYVDAAATSDRARAPTNIAEGRGDQIWIKQRMSDRGLMHDVADKQRLARRDAGRHYLSDHLPLWITVEHR